MDQARNNLKDRTKRFAVDVIQFSDLLPGNPKGWTIAKQIIRSSSSVAANYRAVGRAKSDKDFISKMETVIEESDETMFWLEIIEALDLVNSEKGLVLMKEANELTAIFVASVKTVKARVKKTPNS